MMQIETVTVFNHYELNGIGAGLRVVRVQIGRRWAYVVKPSGRRLRVRRAVIETLAERAARHRHVAVVPLCRAV